jgi:hypothetical protein
MAKHTEKGMLADAPRVFRSEVDQRPSAVAQLRRAWLTAVEHCGPLAIAAIVVAACSVRSSKVIAHRPSEVAAHVASSASPPSYDPDPNRTNIPGSELQALRGLTVDEARRRLVTLGHKGQVSVREVLRFDSTCGFDRVCETNRDGGCSADEDLELHLNPKQNISEPPE